MTGRVRGPSLPTLGEGPPFGQVGPDPYITDYQRRASVDTWLRGSGTGALGGPDNRISLDSQTSAASHMLMGSRGSSMDQGVLYGHQPVVSLPEALAALALPTDQSFGALHNPFAGNFAFQNAASGLGDFTNADAGNMHTLQETGLLDLVNASPDKLELLRALQQLQMQQQAASLGLPSQGSGFL